MYSNIVWRNAPLWNQSSPRQPSTIGFIGTATLSAGCGSTRPMSVVKPSYEMPRWPVSWWMRAMRAAAASSLPPVGVGGAVDEAQVQGGGAFGTERHFDRLVGL